MRENSRVSFRQAIKEKREEKKKLTNSSRRCCRCPVDASIHLYARLRLNLLFVKQKSEFIPMPRKFDGEKRAQTSRSTLVSCLFPLLSSLPSDRHIEASSNQKYRAGASSSGDLSLKARRLSPRPSL